MYFCQSINRYNRMKSNFYTYYLIILTIILFTGCNIEDVSENAARLRIKLTDATSLTLKELHVDINEISVFATDSTNIEGEWITLDYSGGEYNLLILLNGKTVQLVDQYFPSYKKIEKIKIILGNNNRIVTITDAPVPLQLSPEIIDGVVIENINADLATNVISSIIIDINAALSIREINGNWFLRPSARAFPETYGASIKGYVAPIEANPYVAIIQETDTFFTFPDPDGMFYFFGLNEGAWDIYLIANPESNYRDTVFTDTLSYGQKLELTPRPIRLVFDAP